MINRKKILTYLNKHIEKIYFIAVTIIVPIVVFLYISTHNTGKKVLPPNQARNENYYASSEKISVDEFLSRYNWLAEENKNYLKELLNYKTQFDVGKTAYIEFAVDQKNEYILYFVDEIDNPEERTQHLFSINMYLNTIRDMFDFDNKKINNNEFYKYKIMGIKGDELVLYKNTNKYQESECENQWINLYESGNIAKNEMGMAVTFLANNNKTNLDYNFHVPKRKYDIEKTFKDMCMYKIKERNSQY